MRRAAEAGVTRILAVGSDLRSSCRAVDLAERFEPVYAAVGIDPHHCASLVTDGENVLDLLSSPKVVAVGEIGLDYVRANAGREQQLAAFREQLRWAADRDLPVSVHNRAADEDLLRCLHDFGARAVLHCFSGDAAAARRGAEAGFYVSFAGNLTYPRADELRAAAAATPRDRLLVESDAPVLPPQPWRGSRNEPSYTRATFERLAAVRGEPSEELEAALARNADAVFSWGTA